MIEIKQGNLLEAPTEALVNTVNTEGVMGKGIALQFKQAFPQMFRDYEKATAAGEVKLGKMHVYDLGGLAGGPRWIINFPTKGHWRSRSKIEDIKVGLADLSRLIVELGIRSIAVPPLGCGHGGLKWSEVRPIIESALGVLPNVRVLLYSPDGAPAAEAMPNRTVRPKMTNGQAVLISMMERYQQGLLDPFITLLELHKLMYFMQIAGQPLKLQYTANTYGPYATNLRQLLIRMESHFTKGYGDGSDSPARQIELLPGAVKAAAELLTQDVDTIRRVDRVASLMEGYEDPFGLELLSSVHWIARENVQAAADLNVAFEGVRNWSPRKRSLFKQEHVAKAWSRLKDQAWI